MKDLFDLVAERSAFFKRRVETYARANGLDNKEVLEVLQDIASRKGNTAITGILDEVVPPELHSSRMPPIREEVQHG